MNEKHIEHNKNTNLLSDNYVIIKKIGSGSFGEVYLAQRKDGLNVAAKVEDNFKTSRIMNEYKIYKYLINKGFIIGLPKVYEFIQTKDYNIMFMQLLGFSLEDKFNEYNKKFSLETVFMLCDQLLYLIEQLHKCGFIHRDIKPSNFMIGKDYLSNQVYIMDFGLSKKYIKDKRHILFRDGRSLIGTARYASINMHMGIEPSRRDDLESIGYMFIYFLKGSLPWQGLKKKLGGGDKNLELIGETKISTSIDILCKDLPSCFKEYLIYCRSLKFDENPDYNYLKNLFIKSKSDLKLTPKFQWCI